MWRFKKPWKKEPVDAFCAIKTELGEVKTLQLLNK